MHTEIVIVRHGQSEGNRDRVFTGHSPSPLTELGRRQAEATAARLAARAVDAIYVSDLQRAVQTAEPLARLTSREPIVDAALRERCFGDLTGMSFAHIEANMPEVYRAIMTRDPAFVPPGGESNTACRARVGAFLEGVIARHPGERVVLVTHGIAINHMLYHLLGFDPERIPPVVFHIENCSVQRIEQRPEGTRRVACINDTAHLTALSVA